MKPLLSICCTVYNHEKFVAETLEGFLLQKTNFPIEIIIHDDASEDNSQEILKKYAKIDSRIKLILQEENQYSKKNKPFPNFCFPAAKGKYIALCEGDDYWVDSLKIQKQVDFLEANPLYGICFHDVMVYDETIKEMRKDDIVSSLKNEFDINDLARGNMMHTPSVVLRNDFVLPSTISNIPIGDWPLYLFQIGNRKIKKIEGEMAVYRVHENGVWSSKREEYRIEKTIKVIDYLLENLKTTRAVKKIFKKQRSKMKEHLGIVELSFRDHFLKIFKK